MQFTKNFLKEFKNKLDITAFAIFGINFDGSNIKYVTYALMAVLTCETALYAVYKFKKYDAELNLTKNVAASNLYQKNKIKNIFL